MIQLPHRTEYNKNDGGGGQRLSSRALSLALERSYETFHEGGGGKVRGFTHHVCVMFFP